MNHPYLKEEHHIFRASLRRFLEKEAKPYFEEWEEARLIPRSFWRRLGEQGYLCPGVDEKYGGCGADWGYAVVVIEEMERIGSGLLGVSLHNEIVVPYLTTFGTEEQKNRFLPGCLSGDLITAIAMTEPGAGSDLANIRMTARRDGEHFILNGQKMFITNGINADLVVVACKTDLQVTPGYKGISLFLVERDRPGFERGRKLNKIGLHCQDTAELFFEDCRVPAANLLGEEGAGFKYMMEKLAQERLVVALTAQVSAEEMLKATIDYAKTREAFGQPLSKLQNTRYKLVEMATELEIGRTFIDRLISEHIQGLKISTEVAMAKWWLTEMAKRVAGECLQLYGGYGYMEEYPIARRFRDIPVMAIYAGSTEIMKNIIAKDLKL